MLQRKVVVLGTNAAAAFHVLEPFVVSCFSPQYLHTIGVVIAKKHVERGDAQILLVLWMLNSDPRFEEQLVAYMRRASAYVIVADASTPETLERAVRLHAMAEVHLAKAPFCMLIANASSGLASEEELAELDALANRATYTLRLGSGTGHEVDELLSDLAHRIA